MKLEVFEKYTGLRLGLIKTYDFIQYSDIFNGVGDFTMNIPYTEESFPILARGNYILFDDEDMGIIEYRDRNVDTESIVVIKGHMLNKILNYRTFRKTYSISGTIRNVCNSIVDYHFINTEDEKLKIGFIKLEEQSYADDEESVRFQKTGGSVGDSISEVLGTKEYGHKVFPIISNYDESTNTPSNISSMSFRVKKPTDRTQENPEGTPPIVFSLELNNLERLEYREDGSEYFSVAIVAGEGEEQERKVVETGEIEASGLDRIELYVDARDLQKENLETGEILSDEEYELALKLRGDIRLEEHKVFESFSGQVISGKMSYTYRKDFYNGDIVTLIDKQLNVSIAAQITKVTHSATQTGEKLDITFGYKKDSIRQLLKRRSVI